MEEESLFKKYLQAQNKLDYVQGTKRPKVNCILCEIVKGSDKVENLKIYQDNLAFICLNLYPYNPGHLMICPVRHITDFRELTDEEILHIMNLIKKCEDMLAEIYNPTGFNIGLNQGSFSGASIAHLHFHLLPRFKSELGYIDIIGKTRVVVEGVYSVYNKLIKLRSKYFNVATVEGNVAGNEPKNKSIK
ncbi:MAG: HIT family protein [Promethearchaeota archaeon]